MNEPQRSLDLDALKRTSAGPGFWRRKLPWLLGGVVVVGMALYWSLGGNDKQVVSYRSVEARQGSLVVTVTTTGTLQPVNRVDVGSELSGTIASVEVDFNDHVAAGAVLARLDTEILTARIAEAKASVQSAKARIAETAASVTETRVNLKRCEQLRKQQVCSDSEFDAMKAAFQRAQANESMAKSQLAMTQAALDVQQTNLRKAVIRSPISGVVLDRKVEPGQTVAASFQTPVLFTIAEDLKRMELQVAVDEADVGQVRAGQSATFSVDAFPRQSFKASVQQIRQAPKTVEGVVTYETVLQVDNNELLLLPGMTATAQITVNQFEDALLVPNAALRFSPPAAQASSGFSFSFFPRRPASQQRPREVGRERASKVWVERGGVPVAIPITIGASDGQWTTVTEGEVKPGDALLVDVVSRSE